MNPEKMLFLQHTFPLLLKRLKGDEKPVWGKMNPQQMVEHMADSFRQANPEQYVPVVTPSEQLPAFKAFIMTEKEFRPNTKNRILGDELAPVRHENLAAAITDLEKAIEEFAGYFISNPEKITTNPVFGDLNLSEWVQLLHKHAMHHLKQFSLFEQI